MTVSRKAIIYCRVSSRKQKREGSGLDSQEHRCREYAAARGYEVVEVFPDDISGGGDFMNRPGMVALLRFLDSHPDEKFIVIFDDLKRYARDTEFHLKLRREMNLRSATRECLNFNFEDTPEGKFVETILAAQSELEREQNGRQVVQKMKARVEKGYYVFACPPGYKYIKDKAHGGKILAPNEPVSTALVEALEGFATGRFQTRAEVRRFLESHPGYPKPASGRLSRSKISDTLRRPVYAGYVEAPKWGVSLRKGQHEPLISFETFQKIQARLDQKPIAPARKNLAEDFPLRNFIACGHCGSSLTSSWSKGKNRYYPYYLCFNRDCVSYGKSAPRDAVEQEFAGILATLKPTQALLHIAKAMFRDVWDQRFAFAQDQAQAVRQEISKTDKQIGELVERVLDTDSTALITAYETKIKTLELKKLRLSERLSLPARKRTTFETQFRTALNYLSNPCILWENGSYEQKRAVLKLTFSNHLKYTIKQGFRTPMIDDFSLPFRLLQNSLIQSEAMVGPEGLEPPTRPL